VHRKTLPNVLIAQCTSMLQTETSLTNAWKQFQWCLDSGWVLVDCSMQLDLHWREPGGRKCRVSAVVRIAGSSRCNAYAFGGKWHAVVYDISR